jgi:hypothetical protein
MASGAPRETSQSGAKAAVKVSSAASSIGRVPRFTTWPIWISSKVFGTEFSENVDSSMMAGLPPKSRRFALQPSMTICRPRSDGDLVTA